MSRRFSFAFFRVSKYVLIKRELTDAFAVRSQRAGISEVGVVTHASCIFAGGASSTKFLLLSASDNSSEWHGKIAPIRLHWNQDGICDDFSYSYHEFAPQKSGCSPLGNTNVKVVIPPAEHSTSASP